ncbi:MAG: DNA methyltransferase [Chlorobium sp.]
MSKYEDLVKKLKEIFQIDRPELDFGVYRILNSRAVEINDYLDNRLKVKIDENLAATGAATITSLHAELKKKEMQYVADGMEPDAVPAVLALRQKIADYGTGASEHENSVFTHLLTFFSRYYDKGDFISQRRYKGDTYAIPYAGEEVMLYWANKDQYYTKSGENFSNYGFKLDDGRTVSFRLVTADTAKDNRKDNDKERRFALIEPHTRTLVDDEGDEYEESLLPVEVVKGELVLRFEYKAMPKGTKQEELVHSAVRTILDDPTVKTHWLDLSKREPTEKNPQRTLLEKCLTNYTTRNSADYFIHKDLGGFLRRELDFYIKNEVMHLDDVQNAEKFADIEKSLRMIQTLRSIALDLITFLAQLEEFQKKLWLKKKFVVSAHYCVTLDRLPESIYPAIAANQKQWEQWESLGMLNTESVDKPGLFSGAEAGSVEYLKVHPFLMVDTALFDAAFKSSLLAAIDNLDESLDGLLIHGDNFQAVNLLNTKYENKVSGIYIDPPYNTGEDGFIYKDNYEHSSWLSMISNRIELARNLQMDNSAIYASINEDELFNLNKLLCSIYGEENYLSTFVVKVRHENRILKGDKDFHEVYENVVSFRKSRAHVPAKRKEDNTSLEEYIWTIQLIGPPIKKLCFGAKDVEVYPPSSYSLEKLTPGSGNLKRINIRGSLREGNSSGRFYVANIEPIADKYSGHLFKVPNMGSDALNHRFFWTPDNGRRNGDYFQGVPLDRKDTKLVPYPNYLDFEKDFNRCSDEGGTEFRNGKKPIAFLAHLLELAGIYTDPNALVLDLFGGSGSTGHAVINLNREDKGQRKYILIEQGEYFETVLKPRIQKVVYSADWKDGKATAPQTGISHAFKVLKIESYEDTLNNLQLRRTPKQQELLDSLPKSAQEEYLLRYLLDIESRGSLLSVEHFNKPFDCKLKVTVDSAGAYEERTIDLVETFNYLIGLHVKHIDVQQGKGFVMVTGSMPTGEKTLVLWRDLDLVDYDTLNRLCEKLAINPADSEFDIVYINGDHNIPAVFTTTEAEGGITKTLKLRQIEPEFLSRMFTVEGVS